MKLKLIAVKYADYRNIKSGEILRLQSITALIGANESGKSNLLDSLLYLKAGNKISSSDTTIGSDRALEGKSPVFCFYLKPSVEISNELSKLIKNFNDQWLVGLVRDSDTFDLSFFDNSYLECSPIFNNIWKNLSASSIEVPTSEGQVLTLQPAEEISSNANNKLTLARLKKKNLVQKIDTTELLNRAKKVILDSLPITTNWEYDEENFYIKDDVPWAEFLSTPEKYKANERLFELASEKFESAKQYREKLNSFGTNTRKVADYLDKVGKALDEVVKETWSQSNIQIKLENRESKLEVSIFEGGQRIPPSIRSEGLKWFISFLLEFRSKEASLSNYIFLFDQPGDKLHPGGQKELIKRFEDIAKDNQIVYATQSPFMVSRNYWERIQFLKSENGISEIRQPSNIDIVNDELLRQVLGYTLADVGQANEWNIVTEGYWDKIIFRWHALNLNKESDKLVFDFNKISIFDAESGRSVKTRVEELVLSGLNAVGVYDGDVDNVVITARKDKTLSQRFITTKEIAGEEFVTGEDFIPQGLYMDSLDYLLGRKISSTRTRNNLQKQPRLQKLEKYYTRIKKEQFSRDVKEKMWLFIESKLSGSVWVSVDDVTKKIGKILISKLLDKLSEHNQ